MKIRIRKRDLHLFFAHQNENQRSYCKWHFSSNFNPKCRQAGHRTAEALARSSIRPPQGGAGEGMETTFSQLFMFAFKCLF